MAWVQDLSSTCPKIEHLDSAALKRIMGRGIYQVAPMIEFFNATMIGGFGTNLGKVHDLLTVDIKFHSKEIVVPQLEQGHVQTDMGGVQAAIF